MKIQYLLAIATLGMAGLLAACGDEDRRSEPITHTTTTTSEDVVRPVAPPTTTESTTTVVH